MARKVAANGLLETPNNLLALAGGFRIVLPLMSTHKSLRGSSAIVAKRNVLKRFERVDLMKKRGQWKPDSKVIGLPKTKPAE
jgi:small basic protein (TIGR04137 family)